MPPPRTARSVATNRGAVKKIRSVGLLISIMGHYQEVGIGVKGVTSDRGSIPKESPRDPEGVV